MAEQIEREQVEERIDEGALRDKVNEILREKSTAGVAGFSRAEAVILKDWIVTMVCDEEDTSLDDEDEDELDEEEEGEATA
jgi:hypothetical protein